MRAITVLPRQAGSARMDDVPEPVPEEGPVLLQGLAVGVCGTDLEIGNGEYGWAPPGHQRLVLGHESLGRASRRDQTWLEGLISRRVRLGEWADAMQRRHDGRQWPRRGPPRPPEPLT